VTRHTALGVIAAVTAASLAMGACSTTSPGKAGGAPPPLTLTVATDDDDARPAGKQVLHFAEEVAKRSDGSIIIEPSWRAAGADASHWDQAVAQLVASGDRDLGLIPSRAWDALGVTSLEALSTPFLIDDDATLDQVVTGDFEQDLLSGLPPAGVVGLTLLPEGLRRPFGFGEPLLSAADYEEGTIRAPYSERTYATLTALGATPTDAEPDSSAMRGAESSFTLAPGGVPTVNVVLFPKVNTLVINALLRDDLTDDQLAILTDAAEATQQWVLDERTTDLEEAQAWCAAGGETAVASQADIASLHRATRPVVEDMRTDELTANLIDRIEAVASGVESSTPPTCD
jgi:TRAP-type C4-dicarboxylate transport system substrate-binding protein